MDEVFDFWEALDELTAACRLVIDRPRGSQHPRYSELYYPLDYGYLENTAAGDGLGIDVWLGSLRPPILVGLICSVDLLKRDLEIKLLLGCTEAEKEIVLSFSNGAGKPSSQKATLVDRSERRRSPTGIGVGDGNRAAAFGAAIFRADRAGIYLATDYPGGAVSAFRP